MSEHGISHEEARRWYPWLYELHERRVEETRRKVQRGDEQPPATARSGS